MCMLEWWLRGWLLPAYLLKRERERERETDAGKSLFVLNIGQMYGKMGRRPLLKYLGMIID